MLLSDTIIAISSAPSTGGGDNSTRGIIRIAGPNALETARRAIPSLPSTPGHHPNLILPLLHPTLKIASALLFTAPRSFTGDDLLELHLPNSPALLRALLDHLLANAPPHIRLATPGEFSARAFFNQKIDLTQAEGIAATINATNQSELRAAAFLRAGHLHKWIHATAEKTANLLALIEAAIDFVDEDDVTFVSPKDITSQLFEIYKEILTLQQTSARFAHADQPPTAVLVGSPNVGKSSLLNVLTTPGRAIVSPVAGTTRDAVAALMPSALGPIRIIDVAGTESEHSDLHRKMTDARNLALASADLVIHVTSPDTPDDVTFGPDDLPLIEVLNKCDLGDDPRPSAKNALPVSTKTGHNLDKLRHQIERFFRKAATAEYASINQRHRDILAATFTAVGSAIDNNSKATLQKHPELLAADLRHALNLLGQITGHLSPDEILGRIFSQFCIGK